MLKVVYDTFGLTYKMALSTRPEQKLGDDAMWDQAEGALQGALDESGLEWEVSPSSPPLTPNPSLPIPHPLPLTPHPSPPTPRSPSFTPRPLPLAPCPSSPAPRTLHLVVHPVISMFGIQIKS